MTNGRVLTPDEVARRVRVHPETVRIWLRSGYLRGYQVGRGTANQRRWPVPEAEVERLERGEVLQQ